MTQQQEILDDPNYIPLLDQGFIGIDDHMGDDMAVVVRFAVDTLMGPAGVEVEDDAMKFVEFADDIVDLWDVNLCGIAEWGENATPSRYYASGHHVSWTRFIKQVAKKPVLGVGRYTDPEKMLEIEQKAL